MCFDFHHYCKELKMSRVETLLKVKESPVIAVIRMNDTTKLMKVIDALSDGGVKFLEITFTTPNALNVIEEVSKKVSSDFVVGAGTVLDPETARAAILAGAKFIVSPALNLETIKMAHRYDVMMVPGAFTPTEILSAWDYGADIVKVFPATALGPKYFKDVKGPFPQLRLMPTGGVSVDNAGEFIKAGAYAVAAGTDLLDKEAIANDKFEIITEKAKRMISNVKSAQK
jgi:2-dehydro-3-deoxyphosphogluconate aldolase/(4S)-4-hydroxy-2-oxoglutarate aldolase